MSCAVGAPIQAAQHLSAYLRKLKAQGRIDADIDVLAASAMLLGAIFHDAMGREMMPQIYPAASKAARLYAHLLLAAIGLKHTGTPRHKPSLSS